jgi:hypothetical protein
VEWFEDYPARGAFHPIRLNTTAPARITIPT